MIKCINCAALPSALLRLQSIVAQNERDGRRTLIFCEDRLSLAAERTVCGAVEGTFSASVYTFARFLSEECGKPQNVLSEQGSAMAVRRIIEEQRDKLTLFKQLSAPGAAQAVYDTMALLYSSRASVEDVERAAADGGLLGGKLGDIAVIYREYTEYLKRSGLQDRNGYLRRLAPVIENSAKVKGAFVIFLGYQAFTCTVAECVRAAFMSAGDVAGLFIGGRADIYVNEASSSFINIAREFGGSSEEFEEGGLCAEGGVLARSLFNPESYSGGQFPTGKIHIFEADDEETEFEFIAAGIKRHVLDGGKRYSEITVTLPNLAEKEGALSRVFSRYRIPYYADRRIPLAEHPLCAFIFSYLGCLLSGCRPQDVDGVVSSPFFPAEQRDRDLFRNYALRFAAYRGGVFRQPRESLKESGWDIAAVERVRETFVRGYSLLNRDRGDIFGGIRALLEDFGAEEKLQQLYENFKTSRPVHAAFGARALDGVLQVLAEAGELCGGMPLKDVVKILKSGFTAMEIALIPPKADAVFVGDIAATANTGADIVYACGLTAEVPAAGADTALLTDRDMARLEQLNINVSPKIRQVNLRMRETTGLNVCAFKEELYLSYCSQGEGDNGSEIISYAQAVFKTKSGKALSAVNVNRIEKTGLMLSCLASEKLPAIKQLINLKSRSAAQAAVYEALCAGGFKREADAALQKPQQHGISCAKQLYITYDSITPTALETYFSCPYAMFMKQGLRVQEREEGALRAVDTGNFIHSVLEEIAPEVNDIPDGETLKARAREIAEKKLGAPPYNALSDAKSGEYTAASLTEEAVKLCAGMYEQLKNSGFAVSATESKCEINLGGGLKVFGRIDRVDECGDMVRIIDYKTGTVDCSPVKYYMGAKLQLPLYLLAVSKGKRAAGAYYFPASVTYREKEDGVFRLQGFMDGSEEVVRATDTNVQPKKKSAYVDAYLNGRPVDKVMEREDFEYFLGYSLLVAGRGADEMLAGNTAPSPTPKTCQYCLLGGSCGFAAGRDGEAREVTSVNCAKIAQIARGKGENNG